jgi:glycosyltransferase involved in cell wall biosynthesis
VKICAHLDLRYTANATPTGVGKHLYQIMTGLARSAGMTVTVLAPYDQLDAQGRIGPANLLRDFRAVAVPMSSKCCRLLWTTLSWPSADRWCDGASWLYCPQDLYVPVKRTRLAATVHGAPYFEKHLPAYNSAGYRLRRLRWAMLYRRLARRADLLLVVSEYLKSQMVNWFAADPAKTVVVGNGVEQEYFDIAGTPRGSSGYGKERPFVLCVGGLNHMDGAQYLLPVARLLEKSAPELQILIAGNQHEPPYFEQSKAISNITLLGYVPAPQLAKIMHDASALLFLSAWETFGITLVEAMAAGTPVIASRLTAMPETVGEAGLLVDVEEPEEVARQVIDLIQSPARCDHFRSLGQARAQNFTWPHCLGRLLQAFGDVA